MSQLASIYNLYQRMAKNELAGFSVPAFNLRIMAFDTARALFRAAKIANVSYFIIELAQSEMIYTQQKPKDFASEITKAAKTENYQEPIFLQGDHFKPKNNLKKLIKKAISAGFYNIDIDCSELSLKENIAQTNYFVDFIRENQPKGITMNIGGEVGKIGGENTSVEKLAEFLQNVKGISKVAVQTGTSHGKGGAIDWALLRSLSQTARKFGVAGVVQHGASTLSEEDLRKLPQCGVCEVHLATELQDIILKHPAFPDELKTKIASFENKKQALGPLKRQIEQLPQTIKDKIMEDVEEKFIFFFKCLGVRKVN